MPLRTRLAPVRRAVLRRRRPLAAVAAGTAVAAGLHVVAAPAPHRVPVLTAAHDLAAGTVVATDDLTRTGFAPGTVPSGLARDPVGRTLATAVRHGEPLTDVRLVSSRLSDAALAADGRVATPVRLPDAQMAALLAVGDRIDLVATDPQSGSAQTVAADVPVLALPRPPAGGQSDTGALVVVGVLPAEVTTVASAAATAFLSYAYAR